MAILFLRAFFKGFEKAVSGGGKEWKNFQRIHARQVSRGKPSRVKLWSGEEEDRGDRCVDDENIRNLSLKSFYSFFFFLIPIIFKKEKKEIKVS